eukprot:1149881-Pelagomonas_calceolata.AAC.1
MNKSPAFSASCKGGELRQQFKKHSFTATADDHYTHWQKRYPQPRLQSYKAAIPSSTLKPNPPNDSCNHKYITVKATREEP